MMEEKRILEEFELKQTFTSKPIPSKVLEPQFYKIMANNERRREKVKIHSLEITKQREAPFSFWEREKERLKRL